MPAKRSRPKTVEEGLQKLAMGPVNDSVKLVTQPLDQPIPIEGLDLFHIKEIKTNKEGMEIKFYDRLEALKCLDALQQRREELQEGRQILAALTQDSGGIREDDPGSPSPGGL